jgi:hypothetical protein
MSRLQRPVLQLRSEGWLHLWQSRIINLTMLKDTVYSMSDFLLLPIYQSLPFFMRLSKSSLVFLYTWICAWNSRLDWGTLHMVFVWRTKEGVEIQKWCQPLLFHTEWFHIMYYLYEYSKTNMLVCIFFSISKYVHFTCWRSRSWIFSFQIHNAVD